MMKQVIAIVIALVLGMGVSFAQQKSAQKRKVIKTERIQKVEKKGPYCTIPAKERTTKCTEAEQKCDKAEGKCEKAQLNTPDCCQKEFKCCPKTECNKEDKSGCCNKDANAHCLKNKKAE